MIPDLANASVYTDFQGLAQLRAAAARQTPEALRETARQFEALFVQSMLKAMREAGGGNGLFDSEQSRFYQGIYDHQLALEMVKGRGLGIADMLVKDLGGHAAGADTRPDPAARPVLRHAAAVPPVSLQPSAPLIAQQPGAPLVATGQAAQVPTSPAPADWTPESPAQFVRDLMPHAVQGAGVLGVAPEVLVAQAALETGWGQKMIRHADGSNSFNLFGIKADPGWTGGQVQVPTLEYESGMAVKRRAAFRSYASLDEAVSGYVNFVRSNPRYRQALQQAGSTDAYLAGLQAAGYATDPQYADKIRSILQRSEFARSGQQLAQSDDVPLY